VKVKPRDIWDLVVQTFSEWNDDKASRLAAALAYYTIFSLAPLLVIAMGLAGMVFGDDAVRGHVQAQLQGTIGVRGASYIQDMIAASSKPTHSVAATVIGIAVLLFGAGGVFRQLQDALNTIWGVQAPPGRGWRGIVSDRVLAFMMVLGTGCMLLFSVGLSIAFAALGEYLSGYLPIPELALHGMNFLVSLFIITLLFALIFKVVPDAVIAWRDVWIGAALTALLFLLGTLFIGLYLGKSSVASTFGAAASLAVLLIWIYYSAQILFLGAEFAQVYATRRGRHIRPARGAVRLTGLQPVGDVASQESPRKSDTG
jgi:membrane protein